MRYYNNGCLFIILSLRINYKDLLRQFSNCTLGVSFELSKFARYLTIDSHDNWQLPYPKRRVTPSFPKEQPSGFIFMSIILIRMIAGS